MVLEQSYQPEYFSPRDIMATEEMLWCTIKVKFPGLGSLDANAETDNLEVGQKVELPLWIALPICTAEWKKASAEIPKSYRSVYRGILEADACAVNLKDWNQHYYELGMYLRKFESNESLEITKSLVKAFKVRFRLVMDMTHYPISDPTLGADLPKLERDLFRVGREKKLKLDTWMKRGGEATIQISEYLVNAKKRKRINEDLGEMKFKECLRDDEAIKFVEALRATQH